MTDPYERLSQLDIKLPVPPAPVASYVPTVLVPIGTGRALLYIAGQVSTLDGERLTGRCPDEVSVEEAQKAARACGINLLAQMEAAAGLSNVERIAQLIGFVLSTPEFGDQPKVINAASDLLIEVLGEAGRHSRAALGANALPFSVTVEIAAVVVVRAR
ncbi:MAG TPA: RidA family protein [Candidatus Dormibacteraeota bacterium]